MRIRLSDDDGAVAVIVGLMIVVLVGISAFAVDLGMGYAQKRQLSTGADSASLAAASTYATTTGTCASLAGSGNPTAAATTAAASEFNSQKPQFGTSSGQIPNGGVTCVNSGQALQVEFDDTDRANSILGGVLGIGSLTSNRTATAQVSVADKVPGLIPYAMCINSVPDRSTFPTPWQLISYNDANPQAVQPCGYYGGNWYSLRCPGENDNGGLADDTNSGCSEPVSIIDTGNTNGDTSANETFLYNYCNSNSGAASSSQDCLKGNTGQVSNNNVLDAWAKLLDKTILVPIIYPNTVSCPTKSIGNPYGTTNCGGTNAAFPVAAFVGAKVCGYHWGDNNGGSPPNSGVYTGSDPQCAGANATTQLLDASGNPVQSSQDNYLLLSFRNYVTSGTSGGSGTCKLGDTCDLGARAVSLVK